MHKWAQRQGEWRCLFSEITRLVINSQNSSYNETNPTSCRRQCLFRIIKLSTVVCVRLGIIHYNILLFLTPGFGGLLYKPSIWFWCLFGGRQGGRAERSRASGPDTAGESQGTASDILLSACLLVHYSTGLEHNSWRTWCQDIGKSIGSFVALPVGKQR